MKVLVISDTHGDISLLKSNLEAVEECDMILHLGDYDSDTYRISEFYKKQIFAVRGNNDYSSRFDQDKIIRIENHTIFMTHGHKYGVYFGIDRLYYKAKEIGADIVLYGHTHVYNLQSKGQIIFLNPGSAFLSRDGQNSFAIISIEDDKVEIVRRGHK